MNSSRDTSSHIWLRKNSWFFPVIFTITRNKTISEEYIYKEKLWAGRNGTMM